MLNRLKSALLLTPAILVLLVWIGRFSGGDEVMRIGFAQLIFWSLAAAFVMAYCITLFTVYIHKLNRDE